MLNDPKIWGTHLKRREVVMGARNLSHNHSSGDIFTYEDNMLSSGVKESCFCRKLT